MVLKYNRIINNFYCAFLEKQQNVFDFNIKPVVLLKFEFCLSFVYHRNIQYLPCTYTTMYGRTANIIMHVENANSNTRVNTVLTTNYKVNILDDLFD